MRVVTSEIMRRIDRIAIDEMGIPGIELMHNAGEAVSRVASKYFEELSISGYIGIFTGPGNNGGDGWVTARLLKNRAFEVRVFSTVDPKTLAGDAALAYEEARDSGVSFEICRSEVPPLDGMGLAIDALLGTGAKGRPKGVIADFVKALSISDLPIVAVDNPTGADSDSGGVEELAVPAVATVTFGLPKLGQFIYPAREFIGRLFVADIGIPEAAAEKGLGDFDLRIDRPIELKSMLPMRPSDGHKGVFGKVTVIAGSSGMTGAALLSAEGALRSGVGLVETIVPEGLTDIVDLGLKESVVRGVPQVARRRCFSTRALGDILRLVSGADSIALGPGIGTHRETVDLTARLIPKLSKPTVLDADGLNCIANLRHRGIAVRFGDSVIMTPHPGELARLLNTSIDVILYNRFINMQLWTKELGAEVLILKGSPTTISSPDGPTYINISGNDGMATGGCGDILTGLIAGLLAQGLSPLDASRLGVYIHGLAGNLAEKRLGRRGMIAGDIVASIPEAFTRLETFEAERVKSLAVI